MGVQIHLERDFYSISSPNRLSKLNVEVCYERVGARPRYSFNIARIVAGALPVSMP